MAEKGAGVGAEEATLGETRGRKRGMKPAGDTAEYNGVKAYKRRPPSLLFLLLLLVHQDPNEQNK